MKEFCLLAILFVVIPGFAQQDTTETARALRRERAVEAIKILSTGALVVRLPSDSKKIQALKDIIAQGGSGSRRAQRLLDQTIKENREFNLQLMEAFEANYKLSKVYWLHDTAVSRLNAGEIRGFLLNKELKVDPDIVIKSKEWLTLKIDYTDPAISTRVKALILADQQWNNLEPPFPWAFMLHKTSLVLNLVLDPYKAKLRNISKITKKMNKELIRWQYTALKNE